MSDLNDKIRSVLGHDLDACDDDGREDTIRFMVAETFRSRQRWMMIMMWFWVFVTFVLAILSGIAFLKADDTRSQIMYAACFVVCSQMVGGFKLWVWMAMNRNSLKREIKRLELRVVHLADQVASGDPGGSGRTT